jgi:hypothetical protein
MAIAAQHDQVLFAIWSRLTPPDQVVNLELITPAAALAFPPISLQDPHLQFAISLRFESEATAAA